MSYEEFRKRINTARDILVGAVPSPAGQIDQITYALMYKFMNDLDDQSAALGGKRTYFVGDYAKYNWHELMSPTLGAHERLELYRQAIQTMAKNPGLPPLFQEIYQNAFLPFNSPNVLNLFLKEIDKFSHGESDDIGDAYEYLLSITGAQGDVGQFRTPRHIIKFIVEAVNPTKSDSVFDPAAGTAGFLIAAYNHVKFQHDGKGTSGIANGEKHLTSDELTKLHKNYHGFDIDPTMVRTASVNMYLHGFTTPDIRNHDTLSSEDYWNERYDVILANPPFMTPKGGIQPHKKFSINANRAEVLFVDYIASHINPVSGRAGIVVPEGIISTNNTAYRQLRKKLVLDQGLYAVVSLPSGVFMPYSGVKTSILFMDKKQVSKKDIVFIDIKNTGISLGATGRKIDENDLPEALQMIKDYKAGKAVDSDIAISVDKSAILKQENIELSAGKYRQDIRGHLGEYELIALGDVTTITKGKSSSTKTEPGEYPLYLTAAESKTASHYDFEGEGVAVPLISALGHGKAQIKRVHRVSGKFALANLLCFVKPDESILLPGYLCAILDQSKDELAKLMTGAANVSMKTTDVATFKIPLPPLEIQQKIVDEIENKQKAIDHAREIIKTLERERAYFDPSPRAQKEGWPIVKLGEVAAVDNGNAFKSSEYVDSGARVIRITNVQKGEIVDDNPKFMSADRVRSEFAKYTLNSGDLLMSLTGNVGRVGIINDNMLPALLNQRVARLRPATEKIDTEYLFYILNSNRFEQAAISNASGIAQKNMSTEWLKKYAIPLPPLETQKQIVAEFAEEQKIAAANKKLIDLYQAKIKSKLAEVWGE